MLHQFCRFSTSLDSISSDSLQRLADDFESLPVHFMNFHSSSKIEEILEVMEYTTDKEDIQHIIIDNLQFLLTRISSKTSFEKFDFQDFVLEKFRKFATEKNVCCHLFTVILHE